MFSRHVNAPDRDPTYLHSRREAVAILFVWMICLAYTIVYCSQHAYIEVDSDIQLVLGLPSWVFWGIAVPWCAAGAVSIAFALFFIASDDLGEEPAGDRNQGMDDAE